jgi:dipeptidyl-peptidase-4
MLTLERIHEDPPLSGTTSTGFQFSSDARALAFLRSSDKDSEVLDLWAIRLPAGRPEKLVVADDLVDLRAAKLSEEERMELERKRVRHRGIVQYGWCGKDSSKLLFPLGGDLYHVTLGEEKKVTRLTSDGMPKLDPRCSPAGSQVSFVRSGDLYVLDVASGRERRLTRGATETLTHGLAEFIAQEEMGRHRGYFWSPNEQHLAYLKVDVSKVGVKVRPRIYADRTELYEQRYPAAGEANAQVTVHVVPMRGGRTLDVALPKEDGYVPRVNWSPGGEALFLQWQSRDQKRLLLIEARAPDFTPRTVLEERDEAWVELHDDLHVFAGGDRILWSSERTGTRQLFVVERGTGWMPKAVTSSKEPMIELSSVDEGRGVALLVRASARSRERQLFEVRLDGSGERQLTQESGWHSITADDTGKYFVDTHSTLDRPPRVTLYRADGERLAVIDDNPALELGRYALPEPEWVEVDASDGTKLNGLLLPPMGRETGKRYPVVVYVYGGPKAQVVENRYHRFHLFHAYLTQRGYGVFMLDGRGSGNRERSFTRSIHKRFGDIEIEDQIRGAQFLRSLSWVDPERIGIWGWSYGGYASVAAILREDTPFKAAAAVAPVTDWGLYDTHFTERYMGSPKTDREGYVRSDVVPLAGNLRHPLLLMHGMADDNVLFEHTLRLVEALQMGGATFRLMVYPGRAHSLKGKETQLHVFKTIATFFEECLWIELTHEHRCR